MKNSNERITKKERGLIKGAIRRVFSRSELRRKVIEASIIEYEDLTRPRVKKWCRCMLCPIPTPKSYAVVDHIDPVVPVELSFEEMSVDTVIDNLWCEEHNLQVLCEECHSKKTKEENRLRRLIKKGKKV